MKFPQFRSRMTEIEAAQIRRGLGPDMMRNIHRNSLMREAEELALKELGRPLTETERAKVLPGVEMYADELIRAAVINDQLMLDAAALAEKPDNAGRVARAYLELAAMKAPK